MSMSPVEAIHALRKDPANWKLLSDSYVTGDPIGDARRFSESAEFAEARALLRNRLQGATVLDLGAGTGIASYAFAHAGCRRVFALEPEKSELGQKAIADLSRGLPIEIVLGTGEAIPLPAASIDIVYARQVLHHIRDLPVVMRECARVLKEDGAFLACREHVVDDEEQLRVFLANHPVHQLTAGENAYSLPVYLSAVEDASLTLVCVLGPWDSVINAYPQVCSPEQLRSYPFRALASHLGIYPARLLNHIPGVKALVWKWLRSKRSPGRLYSFLAVKQSR